MTVLRRVLAAGLALHGLIHLLGVVAAWKLAEFDDFPYSTEVVGGVDIGTVGMRILGVLWVAAAIAFLVAAFGVLREATWAREGIVTAAVLSAIVCLVQVDSAWRGLVIDLVLILAVTAWWYARVHEVGRWRISRGVKP